MNATLLLSIVLGYFALLLGIAFYTSRHASNESFFIGERKSKWWLVAFGMIGTSLSGMTFISVPGKVGSSGFDYYQVVIGYWIGYFVVAWVLLPIYYRMNLTSIYTYLEKRLGLAAYKTGSLFFILSRTLGATLRLYLVIKVLEKFVLDDLGISFELTAIIILVLILLYTYRGGVKTIVWTDTLQTTFMLLALVVCIVYIMHTLHLGLGDTWAAMKQKGYTDLFRTDPLKPNFFLKQILGGMFITIAMTGLDQEMMQKNISVSNLKDSQKNMITFSFTLLIANFVFLLLGGLLYLYASSKGITAVKDDIFPFIAVKAALPFFITVCFLIGLISALFPSADGALTALTSSFCIDILGIKKNSWTEKKKKQVRLIVHNSFAIVFLGCIFFFREMDKGSLIDLLLDVAGYTYGPLLALFAFGILTKRHVYGMVVPLICILAPIACYILKQHDGGQTVIMNTIGAHAAQLVSVKPVTIPAVHTHWLGNYVIGTELLLINAGLTFLLLLLFSRKKEPELALVTTEE